MNSDSQVRALTAAEPRGRSDAVGHSGVVPYKTARFNQLY